MNLFDACLGTCARILPQVGMALLTLPASTHDKLPFKWTVIN